RAANPRARAHPCRRSTAARRTSPLQLCRGVAPRAGAGWRPSPICRTIASSMRHFAPACAAQQRIVSLQGVDEPFGSDLIFTAPSLGIALHIEICEDLCVPIPPRTEAALAGANILVNLAASIVTIGKPDYRRLLGAAQSAKCVAAYLYSGGGPGESMTDLAWDGHALIYEDGDLLREGEGYLSAPRIVAADIDMDRLRQERMRLTSFGD